jgi:hypothetical protein
MPSADYYELLRLREENGRLKREVERAVREIEGWRRVSRENAELREQLQELKARDDAAAGYKLCIVPGRQHVQAVMLSLADEAEDGDRIRLGDCSEEWVMRGGMWNHG